MYLNFETNPYLKKIFNESIRPEKLIPLLSHITRQTIVKEKTLIVFDEIEYCENALNSLKYFYDEAPEYHIIGAGSFLWAVICKKGYSFPMGKAEIKTLYPMDMEEFMTALGENYLIRSIRSCFLNNEPLVPEQHEKAMRIFREYLYSGGMPECVRLFSQTKDSVLVRHIQDSIIKNFLDNTEKYNTGGEMKKIELAYDSVAPQLSKSSARFQYKQIRKGGRSSEFESALEWLCLSGAVSPVYRTGRIAKPLENYRDTNAFKIYMSDAGLLCAKKNLTMEDLLYMPENGKDFREGLLPNYVNTQLTSNGYKTCYWESERGAEVDFIIQRDSKFIPVEVKSADNNKAKNLKVYMETYGPEYAIKLSLKNFEYKNGKKIVPLYAAFCI